MTSSISLDQVSEFKIGSCNCVYPCSHDLRIKLIDGRQMSDSLKGYEICTVIKSIAKDKIISRWKEDHFLEYEEPETVKMLKAMGHDSLASAEEIVAQIFQGTVPSNS